MRKMKEIRLDNIILGIKGLNYYKKIFYFWLLSVFLTAEQNLNYDNQIKNQFVKQSVML